MKRTCRCAALGAAAALLLAGCWGAMQTSPDNPTAAGGHLRESFDDMARDLAKFLVRLSKGQAPGKE